MPELNGEKQTIENKGGSFSTVTVIVEPHFLLQPIEVPPHVLGHAAGLIRPLAVGIKPGLVSRLHSGQVAHLAAGRLGDKRIDLQRRFCSLTPPQALPRDELGLRR